MVFDEVGMTESDRDTASSPSVFYQVCDEDIVEQAQKGDGEALEFLLDK